MIIAADNLTGSKPLVRKAIEQRDESFILNLCQKVKAKGAKWLDLNPGYLPKAQKKEVWRFLVQTAEKDPDLVLMLDSPEPKTLEMALGFCTRPAVLNMATAQKERLDPVLDMAKAHNLKVIAAAMENQVPPDAETRLAYAALIHSRAMEKGISPQDLIIDPMIFPLALPNGESHAQAVLTFLRSMEQALYPKPLSLVGLSNLITSTAGKNASFAGPGYLAALFGAGLDIVMMDALDKNLTQMVRLCRVFSGQRIFAEGDFT